MPSASVVVFNTAEAAAFVALAASLRDIMTPRDSNRPDEQALKLATAISTYVKATMVAPLTTIDVSP